MTLLDAIFIEKVVVFEAYSKFEMPVLQFRSAEELVRHISSEKGQNRKYFDFKIHYESMGGTVSVRRFILKPEACDGAKWRESAEGWGLISVQFKYEDAGTISTEIKANSEKRAIKWAETYADRLGSFAAWDWKLVEKHCRRLARKIENLAS